MGGEASAALANDRSRVVASERERTPTRSHDHYRPSSTTVVYKHRHPYHVSRVSPCVVVPRPPPLRKEKEKAPTDGAPTLENVGLIDAGG